MSSSGVMDYVRRGRRMATDPKTATWLCPLLLFADAILCTLVVEKVPYTEIDWRAYMQQISQYMAGERNYNKITGDTGPLVYPAAHVYIYRALYMFTSDGTDIRLAQHAFVALYLATLGLVMLCYQRAKVPAYIYPLLILSKRLHSVFMLRLFNDGFAVFFLFAAIYAMQNRRLTIGAVAYSIGLGVKMSMLLALPAVGVILLQTVGRKGAVKGVVIIAQIQALLSFEFLGDLHAYLSRAFELSRQFLFKWTVNWRFVGEETFLSKEFSYALLGAHAVLLLAFVHWRWLRPANQNIFGIEDMLLEPLPRKEQEQVTARVTPRFIIATMLSAVIVGCLCARSLHYQFYAYIAWSTPLLLWHGDLHPVLIYAVWAAQEWAWNVYPSTSVSSGVVVGCLAITVLASLLGSDPLSEVRDEKEHSK